VAVLVTAVAGVGLVRTLGGNGPDPRPDRDVAFSPSGPLLPVPVPPDLGSPAPASSGSGSSRAARPAASYRPVAYEAEATANTRTGSASLRSVPTASGGVVVSYVGWYSVLRFNGVTVPSAGRYTLVIAYIASARRTAYLKVNGGSATTLTFSASGGSTKIATVTTQVTLRSGANTLEFSNPGGWTPEFDVVTVS
jgi:hypothetical protein